MRYIISMLVLDITLIFSMFWQINKKSAQEVIVLPDLIGTNLTELEDLKPFNYQIIYEDNVLPKDTIINTIPSGNSLAFKNDVIQVVLSTGQIKEVYRDLVNTLHFDNKEYLDYLKDKYQIEVIIEYLACNDALDGLVLAMNQKGPIEKKARLILTVAKNPKTILMPNFIGANYQEVLAFAERNKIKVKFYYTNGFLVSGMVISQSIKPNTPVLKNGCYLEVYVEE